jgi:hypothetical protein
MNETKLRLFAAGDIGTEHFSLTRCVLLGALRRNTSTSTLAHSSARRSRTQLF